MTRKLDLSEIATVDFDEVLSRDAIRRARSCESKSSVRHAANRTLVTLRYVFHAGCDTSKIISRPNSLRPCSH